MSAAGLEPAPERFPLRRRGSISLHATGIRHPRSFFFGGEVFTPYGEIIHLARGSRMLDMATRRGSHYFWRSGFRDPSAPEALARALRERIAGQPGGADQLARMAALDGLLRATPAPRVFLVLPIVCALLALLEGWLGPEVSFSGFFSTTLVEAGERWRLVTGNLLHQGPVHLGLNVLGLLALGAVAERALGRARTVLVLGASALGAMLAGHASAYEYAVGASGIVFGLAGALVWLEIGCPEGLPAPWRLPRRLLLLAVGGELVVSFLIPVVAGAAHAGGFLAGLGAALLCVRRRPRARPAAWVPAASALLVGLFAAALVVAGGRVVAGGTALARTALRLEERTEVAPLTLNNFAWLIATSRRRDAWALDVALRLARRAAAETRQMDPNILDTLAEVHFALGDAERALETIDEAIALAPDETYFREQRRRFTGERDPADRPAPPRGPPPSLRPEPRAPRPSRDGPGVTA